ncbi:hypothetical protein [Fluviispira sanaruensis]|uniref:Uncharacterized protein n=1 Tax=Fluviispira sanaruensis TaxID=2493639 RepID=A0A4P2VS04_FLUSA|nr:hypothetical protein [Fluviispira sanaruensis]BBH52015.1 hypothetical protein JCM31447_04520 [Fluviispira sanaruensis]
MLDSVPEINSETNYKNTYEVLTSKNIPIYLLSSLMQKFEDYRAKRKMGWSRPWNKINVCTFESYRWYTKIDYDLLTLFRTVLLQNTHYFDDNSEFFIRDILHDTRAQGFLFYHDRIEVDKAYEGVTLSFGRLSSLNNRYRDRIDIIFESQLINSTSTRNLDLIKIYIDPYSGDTNLPQVIKLDKSFKKTYGLLKNLYALLTYKYYSWQFSEREWYHWSQKFVPYFGERKFVPYNSLFINPKKSQLVSEKDIILKST